MDCNYLEQNKEPNKLSFNREVVDLEFVEKVDIIDNHYTAFKKYNKFLRLCKRIIKRSILGKIIFKAKIFFYARSLILTQEEIKMLLDLIRNGDTEPETETGRKTEVLSQKEIDALLTPIPNKEEQDG